jgi:hypothetical protein
MSAAVKKAFDCEIKRLEDALQPIIAVMDAQVDASARRYADQVTRAIGNLNAAVLQTLDSLVKVHMSSIAEGPVLIEATKTLLERTVRAFTKSIKPIPNKIGRKLKYTEVRKVQDRVETFLQYAVGIMQKNIADRTVMIGRPGSQADVDVMEGISEYIQPEPKAALGEDEKAFYLTQMIVNRILREQIAYPPIKIKGEEAKTLVLSVGHAILQLRGIAYPVLKNEFGYMLWSALESVFPLTFELPAQAIQILIDMCYADHRRPVLDGVISCILVFLARGVGPSHMRNAGVFVSFRKLLVFLTLDRREKPAYYNTSLSGAWQIVIECMNARGEHLKMLHKESLFTQRLATILKSKVQPTFSLDARRDGVRREDIKILYDPYTVSYYCCLNLLRSLSQDEAALVVIGKYFPFAVTSNNSLVSYGYIDGVMRIATAIKEYASPTDTLGDPEYKDSTRELPYPPRQTKRARQHSKDVGDRAGPDVGDRAGPDVGDRAGIDVGDHAGPDGDGSSTQFTKRARTNSVHFDGSLDHDLSVHSNESAASDCCGSESGQASPSKRPREKNTASPSDLAKRERLNKRSHT